MHTLAHPEGDLATARAAADLGPTYGHSTQGAYVAAAVRGVARNRLRALAAGVVTSQDL